jgi:hypothetical protein
MKGSFEFAFILTFVMMFLVLGIGLIRIMIQYQDAKMLQERIVAHIEVMDEFNEQNLAQLTSISICSQCKVSYEADEYNRIEVIITFPLNLPIIDWSMHTKIRAKTIPLF